MRVGVVSALPLWLVLGCGLMVCAAPTSAKMAGTGAPCGRSNRRSLLLVLPFTMTP